MRTDNKKPAASSNSTAGKANQTDAAILAAVSSASKPSGTLLPLAVTACAAALALIDALNTAAFRIWCAAPSGWGRATFRVGAEHTITSVPGPHDSGALPCPEFVFSGWVSHVRKAWGEACYSCSTTQPTRYSLNTGPSGFLPQQGAETMTTSNVASRSAAPTFLPTTGNTTTTSCTSEAQAFALLQATSDATMAKLYLSRGNIAGARRKAVQLLKALQVLEMGVAA